MVPVLDPAFGVRFPAIGREFLLLSTVGVHTGAGDIRIARKRLEQSPPNDLKTWSDPLNEVVASRSATLRRRQAAQLTRELGGIERRGRNRGDSAETRRRAVMVGTFPTRQSS